MKSIGLIETGILSVLFEKEIVEPEEFKKALFKKVDESEGDNDKQATKDSISTKIERALELKIK